MIWNQVISPYYQHLPTDADRFHALADDERQSTSSSISPGQAYDALMSDSEWSMSVIADEQLGTNSGARRWTATDFAGFPDPDTFLEEDRLSQDDDSSDC